MCGTSPPRAAHQTRPDMGDPQCKIEHAPMDVFTVHEAMGPHDASRGGTGAQRGAHTGTAEEPKVGVAGLMQGASKKQYMDPNVSDAALASPRFPKTVVRMVK